MGPDEHISFSHLRKGHKNFQMDLMDEVASDLQLATGHAQPANSETPSLTRTLQLSGESAVQFPLSRAHPTKYYSGPIC